MLGMKRRIYGVPSYGNPRQRSHGIVTRARFLTSRGPICPISQHNLILNNLMRPQSFAFVLNPFHYQGDLPIEVISGAYLDRATSEQLDLIKELRDRSGRAGRSLAFDREPIPEDVRKSPEWDR